LDGIAPLDILAGTVCAVALLRGFFLGLVREAFSLASLCGAYLAIRAFLAPATDFLMEHAGGRIPAIAAPWLAGAGLAILAVTGIVGAGRVLRIGVRAAGLSWADRVGGGLLGAAEGAVLVGVLLSLAVSALGREHPFLARTRTLAALEQARELAGGPPPTPDVAAPPPPL